MAAFAVEIPTLAEVLEELLVTSAESPLRKLFPKKKRKTKKQMKRMHKRRKTRRNVS